MILREFKTCNSKSFLLFKTGIAQQDREETQQAHLKDSESGLLVEAG